MATYADNNLYLTIDGVAVCPYFKTAQVTQSNASQEITAGCGTDAVQRAAGLDDYKFTADLMYDSAAIASQIQHLRAGLIVPIEYGKEGATSGKPRHVQNFVIDSFTPGADNVDKTASVIHIEASGAAE